ncbi:hypothetical protein Agub_g296 [Astrephomene gubernaculifera]|uniref:Uncharacterized protein n=1 Tax=Astrephomene gubernaculifera TaxID=47775 RepID=A0AAD3DDG6_9CHLO|nr:hypothetical protein Agub_g296 [Astrephomene gubernaculifera]
MQMSTLHTRLRRPGQISRSIGRTSVVRVQAQRGSSGSSPEILTAFFYGRALAVTINRRLNEALIDVVSEVSKAMAEQPQRIAELQEEVVALARKEMSSAGFLPQNSLSSSMSTAGSSSSSSSSSGSPAASTTAAPQDPQAAVDDLRAEIAYARAALNEVRTKTRRQAAHQN